MPNATTCSFCGKNQTELGEGVMIAGPAVHICDECVSTAQAAVDSTRADQRRSRGAAGIPTPREIDEHLAAFVIGQEDTKRTIAVAVHNHYVRLAQRDAGHPTGVELDKSNILLAGPTGVGKTHLARSLARFIDVPFVTADATTLTEAGYVGADVESVISRLYQAADGDIERTQRGIVFIDEIDKIARRGASASLTKEVGGEGVQHGLLKLLEGTVAHVTPTGARKNPEAPLVRIDTSGILFICGGAFAGLDRIVADRLEERSIGFSGNVDSADRTKVGDLFAKATPQDFTAYGLIPEFMGRLPVITALRDLDEDDLVRILTEPRNAVVQQYRTIFSIRGVELNFAEDALRAIAKAAIARGTGARGLRSMIEVMLRDAMYELPDVAGETASYEVCVDAVAGTRPARRVPKPSNDDDALGRTG